jgi:hypothetical protein
LKTRTIRILKSITDRALHACSRTIDMDGSGRVFLLLLIAGGDVRTYVGVPVEEQLGATEVLFFKLKCVLDFWILKFKGYGGEELADGSTKAL